MITNKDLAELKVKAIYTNKKIHGVYDKLGRATIENEFWGSLVMQYHKHIYPGIMKRYRGIFGGGGILITFFLLAAQKRIGKSAVNLKMSHAPVAAAAIGHLIFGYWGGQYLMIPSFSFTLYSLIGVCYRNQLEDEKHMAYGL